MKKARSFLVVCLVVALVFPVMTVAADQEYVQIQTKGLDMLYQEVGFSGMTATETDRARTAIMAMLDLLEYNRNASILDNYIFVGLDKEGPDKLMYIAFGGKDSSSMILYSPESQYQHAVLVPIALNAIWVETFMEPFCGKTYWQVSPALMKSLLGY